MNKYFIKIGSLLMSICLLGFFSACDDEPPLPDNLVNFETSSTGLDDDVNEAVITLNLSRAVDQTTEITISFTTEGIVYGNQFTTDPAATNNSLTVTIPANASTASFKVVRNEEAFLEGDEVITFSIEDTAESLVTGTTTQIVLLFSSIVSEGSQLTLQGLAGSEAGSSAANTVFVDFSSNTQTPILRTGWDLGFYTGEQFRVIINNTSGASALMIDKTDINAVTIEDVDTEALAIPLGVAGDASFSTIDDVYGDLNNTVIDEISETNENNKVYVLSRTGGSFSSLIIPEDLVKVRVLRNTDGYTLQYAKLSETTFQSLEIAKRETANFNYISFGSGATIAASEVAVEPAAWDIQWTWSVYFGGAGEGIYPYGFSDIVFINHLGGAKAVEVMTSVVGYETFGEANLSGLQLEAERNVIGSDWRVTSGGPVGVTTDRFYVVEDADGNIYKFKFVSFHASDGGTRGKPVIEYALVKKAG